MDKFYFRKERSESIHSSDILSFLEEDELKDEREDEITQGINEAVQKNQNALIEAPNGTQRVERILKPIQEWISSQETLKKLGIKKMSKIGVKANGTIQIDPIPEEPEKELEIVELQPYIFVHHQDICKYPESFSSFWLAHSLYENTIFILSEPQAFIPMCEETSSPSVSLMLLQKCLVEIRSLKSNKPSKRKRKTLANEENPDVTKLKKLISAFKGCIINEQDWEGDGLWKGSKISDFKAIFGMITSEIQHAEKEDLLVQNKLIKESPSSRKLEKNPKNPTEYFQSLSLNVWSQISPSNCQNWLDVLERVISNFPSRSDPPKNLLQLRHFLLTMKFTPERAQRYYYSVNSLSKL
ncbi:unnamed protein product [Moneuplotes crassus]|uniref:Uncharacterized protein n=1 Tax=Euplotes crassus TaxID=5936 RepID=A0AAD1UDZ0_EUPCR|nr:unnamed protein product [Moneuplotes crassus]